MEATSLIYCCCCFKNEERKFLFVQVEQEKVRGIKKNESIIVLSFIFTRHSLPFFCINRTFPMA